MVVKCEHSLWKALLRRLTPLIGLLVMIAFAAAPALAAGARVKAVTVKQVDAGLAVTVGLTTAVKPKVFTMALKTDNPRIVIDFIGASAGRLPAKIASPSPLARSVRIGKHKDRIRVVIDLTPGYRFTAEQWYDRPSGQYRLVLTIPSS